MKKFKFGNKGFSLVELIIVIAILAILVGVMAPQLIKYMERSKISADAQLCDSVKRAIEVALNDPDVIADSSCAGIAGDFSDPASGNFRLDSYGDSLANSTFGKSVEDILGWNPFPIGKVDHSDYLRSTPANQKGIICAVVSPDGSHFAITIAHSDKTGKKRDINTNPSYNGLEESDQIYAK